MKWRVILCAAAVAVGLLGAVKRFQAQSPVVVMEVPEGELVWTKESPKGAKMCIPAAFTDPEGEVDGEYRLDGKVYHPNKRLKVSIGNGTFYIDRKWHSDTGFQQLFLVYNDKPRTFKDRRKSIRRALCKNGDRVFLIQSRTRMTLTDFAAACAPWPPTPSIWTWASTAMGISVSESSPPGPTSEEGSKVIGFV